MNEIAIGIVSLGLFYLAFNIDEKEHNFLKLILIITALTNLMLIPRTYITEYPYFYYTSVFGYIGFWLYMAYYYIMKLFATHSPSIRICLSQKNGK